MADGNLIIYSTDALGKTYKENMGMARLDIFNGATDRTANAQKLDTFARAVNALTTHNYKDSEMIYTQSVTEALAEGEE